MVPRYENTVSVIDIATFREVERIEVDDNQIAPFLPEVYRKLEWLSKEDVIKRVVSREFGRFLQYYASAPEIQQPKAGRERADKGDSTRKSTARQHRNGSHQPEPGYARLFINFGKRDNFYAREIINLVNRYVKGNVDIGRIDLTANCSFFEVPEADAEYVMRKMAKAKVGDRRVVVDSADRQGESAVSAPTAPHAVPSASADKGTRTTPSARAAARAAAMPMPTSSKNLGATTTGASSSTNSTGGFPLETNV